MTEEFVNLRSRKNPKARIKLMGGHFATMNPPETEHPGILSFSGISGESYEPIASISGKTLEFIEKRNKEVCAKRCSFLVSFHI